MERSAIDTVPVSSLRQAVRSDHAVQKESADSEGVFESMIEEGRT